MKMNRFYRFCSLLVFTFLLFSSFGQRKITGAEYFIDTDPGVGNAIAVQAQDGNFDSAIESLFKNGISVGTTGVHTFNVRVKDSDNNWGPVFKTVFNATSPLVVRSIKVSQAEFFFDTDPGQGNGTTMVAFDGNFNDAIETISQFTGSMPTPGVHRLCIRVKDAAGSWGPAFSTVMNITTPLVKRSIKITAGEFFWDTDPGLGNGTTLLAFDGNFDNAMEALSLSTGSLPSVGLHILAIRVRDAAGTWSPTFKSIINITSPLSLRAIKITAGEYFFDTDPGVGNASPLIAFDGNFDNAMEVLSQSINPLPLAGVHLFAVRVKDASGSWSSTFKVVINVTNPLVLRDIKIIAGEYFFDADPGQGSGTPLIAFDGNFDSAFETISQSISSLPAVGNHLLSIRVKDNAGVWGPAFKSIVNITDPLVLRFPKITAGEFFFDTDPGFGQGVQMLAFDGGFGDAIETLTKSWAFIPDTGFHVLNVRACDEIGNWGPVFKTVVKVLPCSTQPVVAITPSATQMICPGEDVTLTADAGFSSYTWFKGSTQVGTGQTFVADTAGHYKVYVTDANGCPAYSAATEVKMNLYNANITANGPVTFCDGGSVTLTAASGNISYNWSTGQSTQSITVASSGTFVVNVSNGTCIGTDTVVVTVLPKPQTPVITASPSLSVCVGDTVELTSTVANAYHWNNNKYTQAIQVTNAGTYSVTVTGLNGCTSTASVNVVTYAPPIASISGTTNICAGETAQLNVSGGVSYVWTPATGLSSTTIANPIANPSVTTQYKVYATGLGGCVDSATVNVIVNPIPTVSASADVTTVCQGNPINLSASPNGAYSYHWTGPAGYSVYAQNPTLSSPSPTHSGVFTVTATTAAGCSASDNVSITVNPGPVAFASANSLSLCGGDTLKLTSLPNGMTSYSWVGPNGFTSSNQNAQIDDVDGTHQGTYSLTVSNGVCSSSTSLNVVVNASPSVSANASNTSICQGGGVNLYATTASATNYSWTGPNGYTSTTQNPVLSGLTTSNSGQYQIVAHNGNCTDTSFVTISVTPGPIASISTSTTSLCAGDTLFLTSQPNGAADYSWVGPNGFTSTSQNPQIDGVSGINQGTYTVTVSNGSCNSSASFNLTVNNNPPISAGASSIALCEGDTLNLFASPSGATSYHWSGPASFVSGSQNPTISGVSLARSGLYTVTAYNAVGCSSSASVNIQVNAVPTAYASLNSLTLCENDTLHLIGSPSGMTSYYWEGPNGYTSNIKDNQLNGIDGATQGLYKLTVSNGYCSNSDTVSLVVNPSPNVLASATNTNPCEGGTLNLFATPNGAASYQWYGPNYFSSTVQNPVITNLTDDESGVYTVMAYNSYGCTAKYPITINVRPVPVATAFGNSAGLCIGDSLVLNSLPNGMAFYSWAGPNGFTSSQQGDTIINIDANSQGVYTVTLSNGFCSADASYTLTVNSPPVVDASSSATTLCEGSILNLYASPNGAASYQWAGPTAFNSLSQNPIIGSVSTTNSGKYFVTVTNAIGCSATDSVEILVVPGITASISGNSPVCEKTDISLTAYPNSMASYSWTGPNGFTSLMQSIDVVASPTSAGTYTLSINDGLCTATSTYTVVVNPLPSVAVTQFGSVLNAVQNGAIYQWLDCDNSNSAILGQTSQTYTAIVDGNYSVVVILDGCADTSACKPVLGLGLEDLVNNGEITIFPNPANEFVTIANLPLEASLKMFDPAGKLVYLNEKTSIEEKIMLTDFASGVYLVEIKKDDAIIIQKLVVNK
ncbi:MAG: T9SS type A sorting domain-containing protein [Crocinitomicaceae bacterium]|nr:T9SS type A sorting domain-containing protein [Crocinitomicaceae bacterium]